MDFSAVLSVALGLIFLFLILALVTSAVAEVVSTVLGVRAQQLKRTIGNMLGDGDAAALYGTKIMKTLGNPDSRGLFAKNRTIPSYIKPDDFATALAGVVGVGAKIKEIEKEAAEAKQAGDDEIDQMEAFIAKLPPGSITEYLTDIYKSGSAEIAQVTDYLSTWFDNVMERATGWYKRWVNAVVFAIALLIAIALNVNALVIANALWEDPLLRAGVESAVAQRIAQDLEDTLTPEQIVAELGQLEELRIPIGWSTDSDDPRKLGPWSVFGWLVTAAAATLGAPFWFDLLKKVANLRGVGVEPKKPEQNEEPK